MTEDRTNQKKPHNLIIENRSNTIISGVKDVDNFDDLIVTMYTEQGRLTVKGQGLHIVKLSLDVGEVIIEGKINSLEYNDKENRKNESFFTKMFK